MPSRVRVVADQEIFVGTPDRQYAAKLGVHYGTLKARGGHRDSSWAVSATIAVKYLFDPQPGRYLRTLPSAVPAG
jgi:hypothetical protein